MTKLYRVQKECLFLSIIMQVRACGTAHSFSPIFTDANQILIFMDDMRIKDDCGKMRKVIYDSVKRELSTNEVNHGPF